MPRQALQHLVEPALVAERAGVAIAGEPGIDQAGLIFFSRG